MLRPRKEQQVDALKTKTAGSGDMTRNGCKSTIKPTVAVRVKSLLGSGPQFCKRMRPSVHLYIREFFYIEGLLLLLDVVGWLVVFSKSLRE